ncbi:hypothetical protein AMTR_s00149p00037740 [Amborella trichopoda]|uniref:ABC transporter C family member 15 n=2 Tax=Amborella trichopoda TaxID=13333 RepID=W1PN85_AMBTC|nr:hypothetical protein AMTR_s00149p00037740 [Amborella trichopoda]
MKQSGKRFILNTPCSREILLIVLQLAFLGSFILQFLWQRISLLCPQRAQIAEKRQHKYIDRAPTNFSLDFGIALKASLGCSSLLSASHLLLLVLLLLKGHYESCSSLSFSISSEIIQVLTWIVISVLLFRTWKERLIDIPWTLRAGSIFCFFQSALCASLDIYYIIQHQGPPRKEHYVDFLSFPICTYLFLFSIRGRTGISTTQSSITDPLLDSLTTEHEDGKRVPSSYGKATLLQLITFSWLNPLFAVGYKKPLELDDVPDVDVQNSAEYVSQLLQEHLNKLREKNGSQNPSIYKAIYLFSRNKATSNAVFAVINAGTSYIGPYLIDDFVKFLSGKKNQNMTSGYFLALGFFGAKVVETVTQRQWIFGARQLGLRLRAALISHIYKKGLRLSSQSRQSHSSGEIINYISVDIQRISDFIWYSNIIWMLPIQIFLAMYILYTNLGFGSLAGFAATFLVMICNLPITRIQKYFQSNIMQAKDDRMKTTSEVLRNMRTLKLHAWDTQYLQKLEELRKTEYNWLKKSLLLSATSSFIFWGAPTFISVVTFGACLLLGIPLTAGKVLTALATFRMLQDPIYNLPDLLSIIAQAKVSADRIAHYLQEDEVQADAIEVVPRSESGSDIEIDGGDFSWDPNSKTPTLSGIQLQVKRGMRVAVCGTVGSGKSSLLSSILGEMPKLAGRVRVNGTKAYVPQTPWILSGNVRENILFGRGYDTAKYEETIQACALVKDFELFSNGDLTEIGERGINMSGGQKQRIQIARAIYQDADIYILDDPFSAVDAHTGTQLFEECLMKILKDKTLIYVTHQVEFLPAADLILVMQDGRIAQAGKFDELLEQKIGFELLVGAHHQALESITTAGASTKTTHKSDRQINGYSNKKEVETEAETQTPVLQNGIKHTSTAPKPNSHLDFASKEGRLVQDEEREKGSVSRQVYWSYLTAVWGGRLVPIILFSQTLFQVLQIGSNYWMAWASPPTIDTRPTVQTSILFLVYILLSVGSSLCVLVRAMLVAIAGLLTSQKFFTNMLHSVLHAPMSFLDATPTGRILNRASTDQSVLDLEMAMKLGWCAFSIIQIIGTIAVMSQVAWQVFALFIPITATCIWYQQYYTPTARELARLAGIQQAPILHHFAESLTGAATIRAFGHDSRFANTNLILINDFSRPWFYNVSAMEWLSFRLNILSNIVFAFSLVLLVSLPEGVINPSIAGLAVTYGLNLNVLQASVIWNICNAENKMISVERMLQYSNIASEAPLVIEHCRPPYNWPSKGTISFKSLQVRYSEHLPSVLKNITCTFPGKKKVGVVGRTGSGKSTLVQALFRLVEPKEGSIIIDGINIGIIGLHDLRTRLSIIPQDPTMFQGTVRGNLDPLEKYSDAKIWEALDKCQLGDIIRGKDEKLYSPVVENGENWSVGQRQLVCLGRALLKRNTILVLDEATASVDSATDSIIQEIIRQEFKECTVVTIAHRIHTVIDSDLVLVLSEGNILEYDSPVKLLERKESAFSKLIEEYSLRSKSFKGQ